MAQIFRWKKKSQSGRHNFGYNGKRYSVIPGQTIEVPREVLGQAIAKYDCLGPVGETDRDIIDVTSLDTETGGDDEAKEFVDGEKEPAKELIIVPHSKSKTRFDIINPDNPDKPLNTKALKKEEAEKVLGKMLEDLRATTPEISALADMDWDALATFMEANGIEIKDEYESEDDLRQAIAEALK